MESNLQAFWIFMGLVFIGALAYFIYLGHYQRRISKALEQGKGSGPVPEPRNVGKVILIFGLVACVLAFFIWADRLQTRLETLQQNTYQSIDGLSQQVRENYMKLIHDLQEEDKAFQSLSWELERINPDGTLELRFTAEPKSPVPGAEVRLRIGAQECVLEPMPDGRFTGTLSGLELSYGDWWGEAELTLTANGSSRTQTEQCYAQLRGGLLPFVTLNSYCETEDSQVTAFYGWVDLIEEAVQVRSMSVQLFRGGELLGQQTLTRHEDSYGADFGEYRFELERPLEQGEILLGVIEFEDSLGYHHIKKDSFFVGGYAERIWSLDQVDPDKLPADAPADLGRELITDAEGTVLLDLEGPY